MKRGALCLLLAVAFGCSSGGDAADPAWAFSSGGADTDRATGVAAFPDYSGVTVGNFSGTTTLGPGQPNETILTSLGDTDVFVLGLDRDGLIDWVRHAGGAGPSFPGGLDRFSDGSFVVAGSFEQTLTVGVGRADAQSLTSAGQADIFLFRYRADGSLAWAARAGGTGYESSRGVSAAGDGSCVVTGYFQETIVFGEGEPNETTLPYRGQTEAFVARYNPDGTLAWAKRAGGDATCSGNDIAAFADGSCVAAVRVEGTATFGEGEANETQITSNGGRDVVVARYNADGTLAWTRRAGGAGADTPWGAATFADGSCVIAGHISDQVVFGDGEPNETTLTAVGEWDIFVARYDADGTLDWATSAGGALQAVAREIASLPDGSCAITGRMRGVVTFGAGEANETVLTSHGEADIFVARYGPDGLLDWAENVGGSQSDQGESICGCLDGSLLVAGRFQETATFHEGDEGETTLVSFGDQDAFVARFRPDGN